MAAIGPGLAVAATGVGAGDLLAAMLAGAEFGSVLLWVLIAGALLKFGLNEGVARWQVATGTTLIEGWCRHLGRWFIIGFFVYLVLWSFVVAGGLMNACGVAAHALLPALPIGAWATIHSLAALSLVLMGRYRLFERIMKALIGVMVVTLVASAVLVAPDLATLLRGLVPTLPSGSAAATLSLMGGVGGSVTLLSYGYWIRERGWSGSSSIKPIRVDLGVGYALTGVFGVAMLVVAAAALAGSGGMPAGSHGLVACGDAIGDAAAQRFGGHSGSTIRMVFLVGVWGAVFTSTLGVWQGVPYLFADFANSARRRPHLHVRTDGWTYRGYLLFLAIPPMVLVFIDRPIWVIRLYTLTGGLFMPILAGTLLWLNSRRSLVGSRRNGVLATAVLVAALVLFATIALRQFADL
jgi:Mn2+/Fe2+ NRAMP family transporter